MDILYNGDNYSVTHNNHDHVTETISMKDT